ncbi:MAG: quinone-dependent dihydroorotate dehydrogenase [Gammaproteobacteria bacterium]|nr:quinone-dependent dihydroorotate dehydrogenase [Gammaproteobacteria bacterium]
MYRLIRSLLFRVPAESSHDAAINTLEWLGHAGGRLLARRPPALPGALFDRAINNPVGLAAGFDKNGRCLPALEALGFGFAEVGTVTPRAQPGNPRPRLFRLPAEEALINRMGFNNDGVDALIRRLSAHTRTMPVGVNIGKNRDTPVDRAIDDYRLAFCAVAPHADYVTVNLSSPNTPGLRSLQEPAAAHALLGMLKEEQGRLAPLLGRRVPLAVKIAPDLRDDEVGALIPVLVDVGCDAVIATNTTVQRPLVGYTRFQDEPGGLSGAPLHGLARHIISLLYKGLPAEIPIIGVGGIQGADSAWDHLVAGASLVQVYTGFIYKGPHLLREIVTGLKRRVEGLGCRDLPAALEVARRNLLSGNGTNTKNFS